jgi:hypothetical protein
MGWTGYVEKVSTSSHMHITHNTVSPICSIFKRNSRQSSSNPWKVFFVRYINLLDTCTSSAYIHPASRLCEMRSLLILLCFVMTIVAYVGNVLFTLVSMYCVNLGAFSDYLIWFISWYFPTQRKPRLWVVIRARSDRHSGAPAFKTPSDAVTGCVLLLLTISISI